MFLKKSDVLVRMMLLDRHTLCVGTVSSARHWNAFLDDRAAGSAEV